MTGPAHPTALYEGIAPFYDRLLGAAGFATIWSAFQRARRRFAIGWSRHGAADFGCGTGLFIAALARAAPQAGPLYGLDRSPAMLAQARRRLAGLRRIMLIEADMRDVRLPQPVDLVTCNFDTINYLTTINDLDGIMSSFALNLGYEGHLVFDMLVADPDKRTRSTFKQRIRFPRLEAEWLVAPRRDNRGSRTVMQNCVHQGGAGWRCWTETHVQRWWRVAEIADRLGTNGFRCLAVSPVDATARAGATSRWVQFVGRRCG